MKKPAVHWPWHIAGAVVFGTLAAALALSGLPWLESVIPVTKPQTPPRPNNWWSPPWVPLAPHLAALPWQRDVNHPTPAEIPLAQTPWKRDAAHAAMISLRRATLPNWKNTP